MSRTFFDMYPEYIKSLNNVIFAYIKSPLNPRFSRNPDPAGISILATLGYLDKENIPTKKFLLAIMKYNIPADENKFMATTNNEPNPFDELIKPFVNNFVDKLKFDWLEHLKQ